MLHIPFSGTTQRIRAATLIQAATLGEGVRDLLLNAFIHVAQNERPWLAIPDGECPPPPKGTASGCPSLTGGDTLSDTPSRGG